MSLFIEPNSPVEDLRATLNYLATSEAEICNDLDRATKMLLEAQEKMERLKVRRASIQRAIDILMAAGET